MRLTHSHHGPLGIGTPAAVVAHADGGSESARPEIRSFLFFASLIAATFLF